MTTGGSAAPDAVEVAATVAGLSVRLNLSQRPTGSAAPSYDYDPTPDGTPSPS